jgi:hopene-associated glycosyltransferase HpnB
VLALTVVASLSAAVWLYLVLAHGRFWLADQRLPAGCGEATPAGGWPAVVAVVPARDEAAILPEILPSLLGQDYAGQLRIFLVDDASTDGTAEVAEKIAAKAGEDAAAQGGRARALTIVRGEGPPPGWAGKVAAMNRGVAAIGAGDDAANPRPTYILFTDADIKHATDNVRRLVGLAEQRRLDLVSLMVLLRAETAAERAIVPAFVYSFAQLYPFPRVNRHRGRTAAAAGGCMLVRGEALAEAGGLQRIAGARIDDVALGRLIKLREGPARGRIWLGLTTDVRSARPYPHLAELWDMIARSAYIQLRLSPLLLAGTLIGLLLLYAAPPVLGLAFLGIAVAEGGGQETLTAAAGLGAWALMCVSYLPTLRLYRLGIWRAALLPLIMMVYGAMTFDSALRHYRGTGGMWKGRASETD